MTKFATVVFSLFILITGSLKIYSQDIEVIVHQTNIYDTLGSEIVFDFEVINVSSANQVVFEVRTQNDLPEGWVSSLCFGENCFVYTLDSIATTPEFFTPELAPGDTLITSLHVFTAEINGTGNVQIQFGTFHNPTERITKDFTATTILVDVKDPVKLNDFSLQQNYPNPFNPSTKINFSLASASYVTLNVFNILGAKVASLINNNLNAGLHSVNFDAHKLNSGVYFYRIEAKGIDGRNFNSVRKMILTK